MVFVCGRLYKRGIQLCAHAAIGAHARMATDELGAHAMMASDRALWKLCAHTLTQVYNEPGAHVRMADDKAIAKAMEAACLEMSVELKEHQRSSIAAVLKQKDVFVTLATGYGKSMIFHLLPLCARHLGLSKSPLIIVVAPLLSLMEDQIGKINGRPGLGRAIQLTGGLPSEGEIDAASFVFTSPEALLSKNECRNLLLNDDFVARIIAVVVDEAHCIAKWYVVQIHWHAD